MRNKGGRRPWWKLAIFWTMMALAAAPGIAGLTFSIVYRFRNPGLTETQLFMKLWWAYLAQFASAIWGVSLWAERPRSEG